MDKIRCLENYHQLREMFLKGEKGNAKYFTNRLGISTRTLQRLIRYLNKIDNLKVQYDKSIDLYYLKTV
jgi:hypothetical protein